MVLAAVENAVWNTIGYDRSGDEPVEVMDEFYVMYGYLGLFAIVNIGFWLFAAVAVSRTRTKSRKEWKRCAKGLACSPALATDDEYFRATSKPIRRTYQNRVSVAVPGSPFNVS